MATFHSVQNGGRPPSSLFKSSNFMAPIWFTVPICISRRNFIEIGRTVAGIIFIRVAYCEERIYVQICPSLRLHISKTKAPNFIKFLLRSREGWKERQVMWWVCLFVCTLA